MSCHCDGLLSKLSDFDIIFVFASIFLLVELIGTVNVVIRYEPVDFAITENGLEMSQLIIQ